MKVAILSESEADEAVLRILVDGLLGQVTQTAGNLPLRGRGWPSVLQVLPAIIQHLYYWTDADALILVVDSNHTLMHEPTHNHRDEASEKCRLCQLRRKAESTIQSLRTRPAGGLFRIAIGLAAPAIEAWLLCGHDPQVCEEAWREGLGRKRDPYSKNDLKHRVYGTDRPDLELLRRRGVEEARRLIADLATLEARFPNGFGSFAMQIRSWTTR